MQNEGGTFVTWPGDEGYTVSYPYYYSAGRDTVTDVLRDVLGDATGTLFMNS